MADIIIGSEDDLSLSLVYSRLTLEDAINDKLGSTGEVSGGGAGVLGWNIDVEIFDDGDVVHSVEILKHLLQSKLVPRSTQMGVYLTEADDCYGVYKVYDD